MTTRLGWTRQSKKGQVKQMTPEVATEFIRVWTALSTLSGKVDMGFWLQGVILVAIGGIYLQNWRRNGKNGKKVP